MSTTPRWPDAEALQPASDARLAALGDFICADPRRAMAAAGIFRRGARGTVESRVSGVSMGAVIPDGARIRIRVDGDRAGHAVPTGAVAAFLAGGRTVVHRIRWQSGSGRARDWLLTQGDAMLLPDVPVPREALIGRVVAVQRPDGSWQPPVAAPPAPRRERALSWIVFAAGVALLVVHPPLARWFLDKLTRAERRHAWTRSLLY